MLGFPQPDHHLPPKKGTLEKPISWIQLDHVFKVAIEELHVFGTPWTNLLSQQSLATIQSQIDYPFTTAEKTVDTGDLEKMKSGSGKKIGTTRSSRSHVPLVFHQEKIAVRNPLNTTELPVKLAAGSTRGL